MLEEELAVAKETKETDDFNYNSRWHELDDSEIKNAKLTAENAKLTAEIARLIAGNVTTPTTPKHVPNDRGQQVLWVLAGLKRDHVKHASKTCRHLHDKKFVEASPTDPRKECRICKAK